MGELKPEYRLTEEDKAKIQEQVAHAWSEGKASVAPDYHWPRETIQDYAVDHIVQVFNAATEQAARMAREDAFKEVAVALDFAYRVAKVMDNLRSSHVFFVLQQAYTNEMVWSDAQETLDKVLALPASLSKGGK